MTDSGCGVSLEGDKRVLELVMVVAQSWVLKISELLMLEE